jgi:hypothetical protein
MCYTFGILKRRGRDEDHPSDERDAQNSLDDAIDEVANGVEGESMPDEEADRFDVMAAEIADLLRTAKMASRRLESEAATMAQATIDAANERAAAVVAEAEARNKGRTKEAKQLLDEATSLLDQARTRDATVRREADEYAVARRAEVAEQIATATRAREASAETLEKSRKLLSDAEQELTKAIEQATGALAALTAIRSAAGPVEAEHEALDATTASDEIDLTDGAMEASGREKAAEGKADDLDESLRAAVAKAVEQTSNAHESEG